MCEISADVKPETFSVGEISVGSRPSKDILWKIPHFHALPTEVGFWIYSPFFTLADATWCLQMFPNGQAHENTDGWIDLLLLRLHSNNSKHLVWHKFGIVASNGRVCEIFRDFSTFKETDIEWGVAHLMKRSSTLENPLLVSTDGILIAFCEITAAEMKTPSMLPESLSNSVLQMPEHLQKGEILEQPFTKKDVDWKIPDAFGLLDKKGFQTQSSPFTFAEASWSLQIYLIKDENEDEWLGLKLEKLSSKHLNHEINFTLGIKNRFGKIYKRFSGREVFGEKSRKCEDIKYLKKSFDQKYSVVSPNGCVTAFCQLYIKDEICIHFSTLFDSQSKNVFETQTKCGSKKFTWKISNLNCLSRDEGYFIDSSQFLFANATWCLRLYPNGLKEDDNENLHILLVRLESSNSEHQIYYRLGLKVKNGRKIETFILAANFNENVVEIGILNFFKRSDAIQLDSELQHTALHLTLTCEVIKAKEVGIVIPSLKEKQLESTIGAENYKLSPSDPKVFLWPLPNCSELPDTEDYFISSEEFSIGNATWCMKMYPNGFNEDKGCVCLLLVRLHSSHSYHRIHFKLGLETVKQSKSTENPESSKQCSLAHNVVFYANNIGMGVVNFPGKIMTAARKNNNKKILMAYCSIFFIEEISLLSFQPSPTSKKSFGKLDHSQHLCTETALSCTENITWRLSFSKLPTKEDIFVDSPEFFFADAVWCLRIYPSGQKGNHSEWIQLFLLRLQSPQSDHHVHLRLGLKLRRDREHSTFIHDVYFRGNCAKSGVVNLVKRSGATTSHKLYTPDGVLTVFCEVLSVDGPVAALSNQPKCSQPITVQPLQIIEFSRESTTTEINSLEDVLMHLNVQMFSAIPTNFDYFIESEKFTMANATWCLRLYPNGKSKENGCNGTMHLLLVRLSSVHSHHFIQYKFGLMIRTKGRRRGKNKDKKELNSFIHVANIDEDGLEVGVTNLTKRSEVEKRKKMFLTEDTLTVFCQLWIIEENKQLSYVSSSPQIEMSKYFNFGTIAQKFPLEAKYMMWIILSNDVKSMETGHAIDSPLFFFVNDYWRLQMLKCVGKSNDSRGSLELYLIKLNDPSSFTYEVNLQMFVNDSWQAFETTFCKGIFNTRKLRLGLTDIKFASDGYLKIYCQLITTNKVEKVPKTPKVKRQVPGNSLRSEIQLGILQELSFKESAEITWTVFDFSGLEKKLKYLSFVTSPTFELAGNTWILQLYPNGLKRKSVQMCIILVRLFSNAVDIDIVCEFYDECSVGEKSLGKFKYNFRGKCNKSCPEILNVETVWKSKSTKPLSLLCRIFISENSEKSSIEIL